jgi:CheY-like chemotaxis protein
MGRRDPMPRETLAGVQILVIDGDPQACELLATILSYCGALVTTATTADAGLTSIARVMPDIIVCAVVMAGHDGYWFLESLRRTPAAAALPVIAVTGVADEHTAERTLSAGFNGHVRKPIDPWELARLVGTLDRGRS